MESRLLLMASSSTAPSLSSSVCSAGHRREPERGRRLLAFFLGEELNDADIKSEFVVLAVINTQRGLRQTGLNESGYD